MEIGKYIIIILFVIFFGPKITIWIAKHFKRYFPTNDEIINELIELSKDKKLIKKFEKYSTATTIFMIVLWLAFIFSGIQIGINNAELLAKLSFPPWIGITILFVFLITSMGPAAYTSSFIVLIIFKLFNPNLKAGLLWNYHPGALRKGSPINLLEYNKEHGVNFAKLNSYVTKILTIVFFVTIFILVVCIRFGI